MSEEGSKLGAILDGASLSEIETRALWLEFSEHMDANRGDMAGYAKKKGWFSVAPEYRGGKAVLIVRTTATAKGPPPVSAPQKPKAKPQQRGTQKPQQKAKPNAPQGARPQQKAKPRPPQNAKPQPKTGAKPQPKTGAKPQPPQGKGPQSKPKGKS